MKKLLPFLAFFFLIILLSRSVIEAGTSFFNLDWLHFGMWLFMLSVFSVVIWYILKNGFPISPLRRQKMTKKDYIALILTMLALLVALYKLFFEKPALGTPIEAPRIKYPIIELFNVTSPVEVFYKPLPILIYALPLLVIIAFFVYYMRKSKKKEEIVKFKPELTFETIDGTKEERVIKMYKNIVAGLVRRGYPYQKSWTHWEHEDHLKDIFEDLKDLHTLTAIFEKAKYGRELSEEDVEKAKESYKKLMEYLA
ncbi:hypothetical protein PAP_07110 [Palaeococcus pacificus DY20341]|uniref:Protein-glutamine gamma-glutamyltransferase-like C-terminal domain-containing protein n=1 Tax=Palaeococcus pacificus DY20341 TaxID=1343739 RepID=A0A075LUZ6_9EURY|nr:DUF4129 domain-containing protein [Palaeococcus pacificus]AIF69812.1 hypothetical protein PAP_07110 [Palaeococcus pacificus DY20341]